MSRFVFYTCAYNAEKTLERTVQSVLNQTYQDFTYYFVDNGSTDGTGDLIRALAQKDTRIIPLRNEKNYVWEPGNRWVDVVWRMEAKDVFCFLDADDAYKPEFAEHMLSFLQKNDLDMAACGYDFIDTETQKLTGVRKLSSDLIVEGQGFSLFFPTYHQFMRTMWGKLYTAELLRRFDFSSYQSITYGEDTLFTLENCKNAKRMGILAESLHQYYISPKSLSYRVNNDRVFSAKYLYLKTESFLNEKCGLVTPVNRDFLLCVFINELWDALGVIMKAEIPVLGELGKLDSLLQMFDFPAFQQLLAYKELGGLVGITASMGARRRNLFEFLIKWMRSLDEVGDAQVEQYCALGELLCASMEETEGWLFFQRIRIQFLLEQGREEEARDRIAELEELGISFSGK